MDIELTPHETRVIGCLIEKELTTPEQYPLSLNALINACNQKSNRDPVLELNDAEVQRVVDGLIKKSHVSENSGFSSRVPKYQHRFCNSTYGILKFSPPELGIICELFLRGPQTPGELRSHASRLHRFSDVGEVEAILSQLAQREDGPFVVRLQREPGKRESRYAHLFSGSVTGADESEGGVGLGDPEHRSDAAGSRWNGLEARLADLEAEVAALRQRLDDLSSS